MLFKKSKIVCVLLFCKVVPYKKTAVLLDEAASKKKVLNKLTERNLNLKWNK
jgi:hypothetical protein